VIQSGYGYSVAFNVTPNDTTQLNLAGFMVATTAGTVVYLDNAGVSHTLACPVGVIIPVPAQNIMAASTAVGIVGFQ
jgi:hypothetical protein